jgi:hypothetical protein
LGDFDIEQGDALFVWVENGPYTWKIVGAHDPDFEFVLYYNEFTTDFKILSLPYHRTYQNATHITDDFGDDDDEIRNVGQFNIVTQKWDNRQYSGIYGWKGDFDIYSSPLDAVLFDVSSDSSPYPWKPQVSF